MTDEKNSRQNDENVDKEGEGKCDSNDTLCLVQKQTDIFLPGLVC